MPVPPFGANVGPADSSAFRYMRACGNPGSGWWIGGAPLSLHPTDLPEERE